MFSVGLEYFFSDDHKRHAVGNCAPLGTQEFPEKSDGRDISFYFESLDFAAVERKINAYYAEFQSCAGKSAHASASGDRISVGAAGKLEMQFAHSHVLGAGDSIYFDSCCRTPIAE